jgi:monoterpene epsilon-lactone hydrolase
MPNADLQHVLSILRRREHEGVSSIEEARARLEAFAALIEPIADVRLAPTRVGGVPCEWVWAPDVRGTGALVYLHGGGYGLGSIATHRALVSRLSQATGLRALAVGYRLAPEDPFPAAVEDAVAVYRSLLDDGVPPERLVVAGDSAGGGLAMATMVALRDIGGRLPAAAVCLSPWVDLEVSSDPTTVVADADPMVTREELQRMAGLYLAGADPRSPLASPLHAELHGLPPLLVQVGTAETLLDDSLRLAERVRTAGGDVTLEPWRDMIHVWQAFAPLLPDADEAIARIGSWVRDRLTERATATPQPVGRAASVAASVGPPAS